MTEQIIDKVCDTLNTYLVQKLQTEVSDVTKAILVREGKLQDSPTDNYIYILTHSGDPDDPEKWGHNAAGYSKDNQPTMQFGNPPYVEIGGREAFWWRRLSVEIGCFFVGKGYTRDQARQYAHVVLGRTELAIQKAPDLLGMTDDFGEKIHAVYIAKSYLSEGGGPPDFIWRGKVFFVL